jgi:ribosome-binding protein aMBF1 (putative translation factor)
MTPAEFHACRTAIGWSGVELAKRIAVDEGTVRQWGRGSRPIPEPIAAWLRKLSRFHLSNPPPAAPDGLGAVRGKGRPMGGSVWPRP